MEHPDVCGLFNVGTGTAVGFLHMAEITFKAMGLTPNIEYTDMPENIRQHYLF